MIMKQFRGAQAACLHASAACRRDRFRQASENNRLVACATQQSVARQVQARHCSPNSATRRKVIPQLWDDDLFSETFSISFTYRKRLVTRFEASSATTPRMKLWLCALSRMGSSVLACATRITKSRNTQRWPNTVPLWEKKTSA